MTPEQIDKMKVALQCAKAMREQQRESLKTRDRTALIDSKRLETALDLRIIALERDGLL